MDIAQKTPPTKATPASKPAWTPSPATRRAVYGTVAALLIIAIGVGAYAYRGELATFVSRRSTGAQNPSNQSQTSSRSQSNTSSNTSSSTNSSTSSDTSATFADRCNNPDPNKNLNFHQQFFESYIPVGQDYDSHPYADHYQTFPDPENRFRNVWYHTIFPISEDNRTAEQWIEPTPDYRAATDSRYANWKTGGFGMAFSHVQLGLRQGDSFLYRNSILPGYLQDYEDKVYNLGHIFDWETDPPSDAIRCPRTLWVYDYDPGIIGVDRIATAGSLVSWKPGQFIVYLENPLWCDKSACHVPAIPKDFVKVQARLIGNPGAEVRPFKVTMLNAHLMAKAPAGPEGNTPTSGDKCSVGQYGMKWCMQHALTVHWNETAPRANLTAPTWPSSGELIANVASRIGRLTSLDGYTVQLGRNGGISGFLYNPDTKQTYFGSGSMIGLSEPWDHIIAENNGLEHFAQNIQWNLLAKRLQAFITESALTMPQANGLDVASNPNIEIPSPEQAAGGVGCNISNMRELSSPGVALRGTPLKGKGGASFSLPISTPAVGKNIPAWSGYAVWKDGVSSQNGFFGFIMAALDTLYDHSNGDTGDRYGNDCLNSLQTTGFTVQPF